jgi:hypothetical protein
MISKDEILKELGLEEQLPDMPAIIAALEESIQDIDMTEDFTKITKRELLINQQLILESLRDLAMYTIAKSYAVDILDKAVAHLTTKEYGETDDDEDDDDVNEVMYYPEDKMSSMFA